MVKCRNDEIHRAGFTARIGVWGQAAAEENGGERGST